MSQQPVPGTCSAVRNVERAAPGSPIWPCTRWGFPCLRACAGSGGLLPHLFTLTGGSRELPAVCSLWHCPSARLAAWPPACIRQPAFLRRPRRLRGIAPYGVRTFLLPRIAPREAILHPSKINANIPPRQRNDKRAQRWYNRTRPACPQAMLRNRPITPPQWSAGPTPYASSIKR